MACQSKYFVFNDINVKHLTRHAEIIVLPLHSDSIVLPGFEVFP